MLKKPKYTMLNMDVSFHAIQGYIFMETIRFTGGMYGWALELDDRVKGDGWPITSGMDIAPTALKDRVLSVSSPLCLSDISSEAGLKVRLLLAEVVDPLEKITPIRPSPVFTNF